MITILTIMTTNNYKLKLLLHSCCAPCLAGTFDQVKDEFKITIFWYNPNIEPDEEYQKRFDELKKYLEIIKIPLINNSNYRNDNYSWDQLTKNYSFEPENGKRCRLCIKDRLLATAKLAKKNNFDFFGTTLTVSPYKNSGLIKNIAEEISPKLKIRFLDRDYKNTNGHKRSIELCKELNIYRQKYCGCQYSQNKE